MDEVSAELEPDAGGLEGGKFAAEALAFGLCGSVVGKVRVESDTNCRVAPVRAASAGAEARELLEARNLRIR